MKNTNFSSTSDFKYEMSQDLDALSKAHNYHMWIISFYKEFLPGRRILEVGGGSGNFAKCLLESKLVLPENLFIIEPSVNLHKSIMENLSEFNFEKGHIISGYTSEKKEILKSLKFDIAIYNNVFEHIDDDQKEMNDIFEILNKKGTVLSYTPAMPSLYSNFDKLIGHYRRYTKEEMYSKFEKAGFNEIKIRYIDFWGIFIWFINLKLLKKTIIDPSNMSFYDKYLQPILSIVDISDIVNRGKNILCIAKK